MLDKRTGMWLSIGKFSVAKDGTDSDVGANGKSWRLAA
jgi:hypothetical protein